MIPVRGEEEDNYKVIFGESVGVWNAPNNGSHRRRI
jgi:hypothetical protein